MIHNIGFIQWDHVYISSLYWTSPHINILEMYYNHSDVGRCVIYLYCSLVYTLVNAGHSAVPRGFLLSNCLGWCRSVPSVWSTFRAPSPHMAGLTLPQRTSLSGWVNELHIICMSLILMIIWYAVKCWLKYKHLSVLTFCNQNFILNVLQLQSVHVLFSSTGNIRNWRQCSIFWMCECKTTVIFSDSKYKKGTHIWINMVFGLCLLFNYLSYFSLYYSG
jgi:hypothetical protein